MRHVLLNALNFILGVHPGSNTASFASGVGATSMTTAYGTGRTTRTSPAVSSPARRSSGRTSPS